MSKTNMQSPFLRSKSRKLPCIVRLLCVLCYSGVNSSYLSGKSRRVYIGILVIVSVQMVMLLSLVEMRTEEKLKTIDVFPRREGLDYDYWRVNVDIPDSHTTRKSTEMHELPYYRSKIKLPKDMCNISALKPWNRVITKLNPPIAKNCELLKQYDSKEVSSVKLAVKNWKNSQTLPKWKAKMRNCSAVVEEFSNNFYVSQEELDFPIAFSLIVYNNPQQIVRLLKAIYRPQNLYCIHADARQGNEFADIFRGLSTCLGNVFVSSKLEKVYYEHHTILDAQLNCLRDHTNFSSMRWKYAINLCGKELPLKTNREIVTTLKGLNGVSAIESIPLEEEPDSYYRFTWKAFLDRTFTGKVLYNFMPLGPPPHGLKIYKGQTYTGVSHKYAEFLFESKIATDFLKYLKDVKVPEEHFYASLYHSANASAYGGYRENVSLPFVSLAAWLEAWEDIKFKCEGRNVHNVCIVTAADIKEIYRFRDNMKQELFFFNKYFMEHDHVVMDCMEEQLLQQNRREYQRDCILV